MRFKIFQNKPEIADYSGMPTYILSTVNICLFFMAIEYILPFVSINIS